MDFILASASPRRKELLERAGFLFRVVPSDCIETYDPSLPPQAIAVSIAAQKAADVAARFPTAAVLAADTIVYVRGEVYGKPKDAADAFRMLKSLAGATHEVVTGVVLIKDGCESRCAVTTRVTFAEWTDTEITHYIEDKKPFDKAGAYGIQEIASDRIKYEGSYDNVVGLPVETVVRLLKES